MSKNYSSLKNDATCWFSNTRTASLTLLLLLLVLPGSLFAQVANYTFSQSSATYTPLSTSTPILTSGWDDEVTVPSVTLPFTFRFNNIAYGAVSVNSNGYVTFGAIASSGTAHNPISATTNYAGAVAAFAADLISSGSSIVTGIQGTAPTRVFVIQWNNAQRYDLAAVAGDAINFQIRLYEGTNVAEVRFGSCTATDTDPFMVQSGIRGNNNGDYKTRTTTTDWSATTAGSSNAATLTTTNTIMPASGLTFTYTPPPLCSGMPNAGAVSPASSTACAGMAPSPITVTGQTSALGLNYLWQESDDNGVSDPWAIATGGSGGNTLTYSPPVLTTTKYYRLRIICGANAAFSTSGVIALGNCNPPSNDNPCGAVTLTGNTGCNAYSDSGTPSTTNVIFATNTNTNGVSGPGCAGAGVTVNDVWFKFTATATTHGAMVTPVAGFDAAFEIYSVASGTCGGSDLLLNPITCVNSAASGVAEQGTWSMTPGQDYYFRVYRHPSGSSGAAVSNSQFSICISNPVPVCTTNASPADLATNVSLTPTLTWAAATYADSYDIYLGTTSGPATLLANETTTSYTLTVGQSLSDSTQYFWYVVPKNASGAAVCGAADETSFTTLNSCNAPSDPTTFNVTHNTATISWTAASPAPVNGYEYEIRTSGAAGSGPTGLQTSGATVAGDTDENIAGLSPATTYNLYVRSVCSGLSDWTNAHEFTTAALSLPEIDSFAPAAICFNGNASERTVVITGSNFTGTTAVTFNGTDAESFAVDSDTQITAVVAAASGTGTIAVTNADGSGTSVAALTINNPPAVANITAPGGATIVCLESTLTLSNTTSNGVWGSSDQNIATIDNAGVVTPVAMGSVEISYTVTDVVTGCVSFVTYALAVSEPVEITSNTSTQTIAAGTDTSFSVTATGTGNPSLSYQWEVCTDGSDVNYSALSDTGQFSGSNTDTLSLTNVSLSFDGYMFRCVVTGVCNAATSDAATLFVGETTIVSQPEDVTLCDAGNASFTVTASNDATSYQWQEDQGGNNWQNIFDGGLYSGTNTETLSLTGVTLSNNGYRYRCQVNGLTSAESDAATLTVNESVAITASTPTHTISANTDTSFSVTATGTGNPLLSYQWQVCTDGSNLNFTPVSDVNQFSGSATATLSLTNVPLSFDGYVFRCAVSGICNTQTSDPATLFVAETTIDAQPEDVTICDSEDSASFTVDASDDAISYQWQEDQGGNNWQNVSDGGIYSGTTTPTLSLSGLTSGNNGWRYRAIVTGMTIVESSAATLTVIESVTIDTDPTAQTVCSTGGSSIFSVTASGGVTAYQWELSLDNGASWNSVADNMPLGATYSGANAASLTVDITNATPIATYLYRVVAGASAPCAAATSTAASLSITASAVIDSNPIDQALCNTGGLTAFSVGATNATSYQWELSSDNGANWNNVADNTPTGATYSGATSASLTVNTTNATPAANYLYRAVIGSAAPCAAATSDAANLSITESVVIDSNPNAQTLCSTGGSAVFNVGAANATSYQWEFSSDNGANWNNVADNAPSGATYSGAASASLTVNTTNATPVATYLYRAVVNAVAPCNGATSDSAALAITESVAVTEAPAPQAVCAGDSAVFNVTATGSIASYQWEYSSDNGASWTNVADNTPTGATYSGATSASLSVSTTNATPAASYLYRAAVIADAPCASATSDAAALTVSESVTINVNPTPQNVCASGGSPVFSVDATGATSYQWQYSPNGLDWDDVADNTPTGTSYAGESSASLIVTTTIATPSDATHLYRVVVSAMAPCASATSDAAELEVSGSSTTEWFVDADGDGYGNSSLPTQLACSQPSGYAMQGGDCDDSVATTYPNAEEIPFNGADDDCDGSIDETGVVTTSLLASACGSTLNSIGSLIGITTVPGHPITGYRIRATNGSQVQIIEKAVPHFAMPAFPSYAYATTYTIDIQLQRDGLWQTAWGPACEVSTPAILQEGGAGSVIEAQCGITLAKINTLIATTSLPGVTGYRFRVTNLSDPFGPNAVQVIDRSLHWFGLQMLARYNYGTVYKIEVAVKTTGDFGNYGSPCEISSPPVPSIADCGGIAASLSTRIATTSLSGVTQYRFQIIRASDNTTSTIDRPLNYFTFFMVPPATFSAGELYYVRVAVMTANMWSPFGDACEITAPGTAAKGQTQTVAGAPIVAGAFKAEAYPNPFTANFNIDMTTSSHRNVQLKVYDMLGKLVESREIRVSDLEVEKLGAQYPSGVYNVVINHDGIVKTLRVIKR